MNIRRMYPVLALTATLLMASYAEQQPAVAAAQGASAPQPALATTPDVASGGTLAGAPRAPLPVRLVIPAIRVDAPVEQVGTTPDGSMDVPTQWNDVGWYSPGFRPGEPGSAVMAGHLDSTTDRAVFWDLNKLRSGDAVQVIDDDGSRLDFAVRASETYAFDDAPLQKIFGAAAAPGLNLVTCNGTFDQGSKNYNKRLVVYTTVLPAAPPE